MQKKTLFAVLAMLAISMPVLSIELPEDATPTFEKSPPPMHHRINSTI